MKYINIQSTSRFISVARRGLSLKLFLYAMLSAAVSVFFVAAVAMMLAGTIVREYAKDTTFTHIADVPELEIGVLLGTPKTAMNGSVFSLYYTDRITAAAALYHNGKIKKIIASGFGNPASRENKYFGDQVTSMKEDLMHLGVRESDIILDRAGDRTLDSVLRARDTFDAKSPIFISQYKHALRAVYQAKQNGYHAYGFSCDQPYSPIHKGYFEWREARAQVLALIETILIKKRARTYDADPYAMST